MKRILCLVICVFLLTGCNYETRSHEYVGESDNWAIDYKYNVKIKNDENHSEFEIKINYKGEIDKLANGEAIQVTYKIGEKSGSETFIVKDASEPLYLVSPGNLNASTLEGNEVGIITVSWGENYEEFEIKSSKE
ncbi:hypothetical protein [Solibacillus sp. FSL W7-1324]|uniref:hypothetical protein n=1 Tax=Solibacillus sp. FSL W7-1324 TaxID=2921701 RepID=UPI0030F77C69